MIGLGLSMFARGRAPGGAIQFLTSSASSTYGTVAPPDVAILPTDFMLACIFQGTNVNDTTIPTGWTLVGARRTMSTTAACCWAWAPGSANMGAGLWLATGAASGAALLLCYRGVDLTNPIAAAQTAATANTAATVSIPALTLAAPGRNLIVGFHALRITAIVGHVPNLTARRKVSESAVANNIAGSDSAGPVVINPPATDVTHGSAILHAAAHIELRAA